MYRYYYFNSRLIVDIIMCARNCCQITAADEDVEQMDLPDSPRLILLGKYNFIAENFYDMMKIIIVFYC